ncbi:MAG: GIY-YIG nuclease family protein [Candidatus Magasanikbacteria bacterium]|nr:GIY-YIG nuclease family protein [Candidatus Magasanikbacteria bacterium]
MEKQFFVYIATNKRHTVLYTGITNNVHRRMFEHKEQTIDSFTKQYNVNKLVWFQIFQNPNEAIAAEKKIKGWIRIKKIALINEMNPTWRDFLSSC